MPMLVLKAPVATESTFLGGGGSFYTGCNRAVLGLKNKGNAQAEPLCCSSRKHILGETENVFALTRFSFLFCFSIFLVYLQINVSGT